MPCSYMYYKPSVVRFMYIDYTYIHKETYCININEIKK